MIETERLILRKIWKSDIKSLMRLYKDKDYYRFTRIPWPYTKKEAETFIRDTKKAERRKEKFYLAIIEKETRLFIGSIAFNRINWEDNVAEIGFSVGKDAANKGYVTEAARAFIDYGFKKFKFNRIEIGCAVQNKVSKRVIEKLGAKEEGILRQVVRGRDGYFDCYMHSILKSEWKGL